MTTTPTPTWPAPWAVRLFSTAHLPMLDLIEQLANDYKAMDASDSRSVGLAYALQVLGQSYAEHPAYQQEWRP
ncbi:DUF6221 family protein [Streptomyces sp. IBSBF 2806]|uniref:DUF6221 family protein n=1 Tax=Streptomyces sp. IBSBF 2806 TaxID=2903529 RepID=UPI002FDBE8FA